MKLSEQSNVSPPKTAQELLNMYFLEARSHLLETAAILDRIERAKNGDQILKDPKMINLFQICDLLTKEKSNRAEKVLNLLSV
ncbi:MAG: hypothetical protein ABIJ31_04815 [Pseudomonadota bacterium]